MKLFITDREFLSIMSTNFNTSNNNVGFVDAELLFEQVGIMVHIARYLKDDEVAHYSSIVFRFKTPEDMVEFQLRYL